MDLDRFPVASPSDRWPHTRSSHFFHDFYNRFENQNLTNAFVVSFVFKLSYTFLQMKKRRDWALSKLHLRAMSLPRDQISGASEQGSSPAAEAGSDTVFPDVFLTPS